MCTAAAKGKVVLEDVDLPILTGPFVDVAEPASVSILELDPFATSPRRAVDV